MPQMADESWMQAMENPKGGPEPLVKFYTRSKRNEKKSRAEGRPIFDEREYVEIRQPGQKLEILDVPVLNIHRNRFPRQYQAFKAGREQVASGTPLAEWPGLTRSECDEMNALGIRTVEQLAECPDDVLARAGMFQARKQKARDYLERARGGVPEEKLRTELAQRDNELAALKAQMAELVQSVQSQRAASEVKPTLTKKQHGG